MSAAWRRGQGRARVTRNRCTVLERLERRNLLAGDLVLSGLVDASLSGGTPKAAELYVRADVPDLSRYAIGSANNGQGSDGAELTLAGTANAGQFLYVASESTQFESFFGFTPDFVSSALNVNGDDAIELFFDSSGDGFANPLAADDVVSDVFGDIHTDGTGQVWEYMDGWAYRISGTGPDGSSFSPGSWTYSGVNALDGETTNDTAANPFPIGGYSAAAAMPSPSIVINEVDSDTPSTDTEEFIELYDGGVGDSSLDGLVVVLFNGNSDQSYGAYDLAGYTTDPNGFFVLGGAGTPNVDLVIGGSNVLQNGPDAVALFFGTASDFPNGTPLTTTDLVDAVVYATNDGDDHELISAFGTQFDEDANGAKDTQSVSRSPDGGSFTTIQATPGTSNGTVQAAPEIDILGQGISIAAGDTTPSTSDDTDFGQRDIRSDSTSHTFSIDNLGTTTLNIFDITVTGPHAQDFVVGTFANTVDPGSSETFEVTFDPSEVGVRSATITVSNDDSDEATYEFAIQGSGIDVATHVVINEVDSDTPGTDTEEFVELYDGGAGTTALDGLVVVLFNGNSDVSYAAVDLSGQRTDAEGFFVLGSSSVPNVDLVLGSSSLLQNGADAVVLYAGSASGFPSGTPITTANLVDSVVYGTADPDDVELVAAFGPQIDEDANGAKDTESVSRSPDGGAFLTKSATPGTPNGVVVLQPDVNITGNGVTIANGDQTPSVDDGTDFGIALLPNETISRPFTIENVAGNATLNVSQVTITGTHASEFSLGPYPRSIPVGEASDIDVAFHPADRGIRSALVTVETNDPDEGSYQFAIQGTGIETAGHVLINEVDADTPGSDTEEFIELFDGGVGNTTLDGLLVVLFNGTSDESYRAFDLSGHATNDDGFFVLGNTAVANVDLDFGAGSVLQNGPDAVALYSGRIGDYPNGTAISTANLLDAVVYATTRCQSMKIAESPLFYSVSQRMWRIHTSL